MFYGLEIQEIIRQSDMNIYIRYFILIIIIILISDKNIFTCKNFKKIKKEIKNEI